MSATVTILLLWVLFAASHIGLSSTALRPRLVGRIGEQPFLGLYSVVALAIFVPLVWFYFAHKHVGPWLWAAPRSPAVLWLLYVGMGVGFVLMASSFTQPNPSLVGAGRGEARGVFLLARHPLFTGMAIWAALHLVVNASTADVAFFGGALVFLFVGTAHQDRRKLATGVPGYREFYEATPYLPFTGRHTLTGLRELSPIGVGVGIALTVLLRVFHDPLFGP
jgi:uncharacterized membrane protein